MMDVQWKETIFLIVFIAIIAVPIVLSLRSRGKDGENKK